MSPSSSLTQTFTGIYVTSIFAGAFAFGVGFDLGVTAFYDRWNKGVCLAQLSLQKEYSFRVLETMEGYPS